MRLPKPPLVPAAFAAAVLALGSAVADAQPPQPDDKRVVCLLSDWGRPRCVDLDDLRRQLPPQQYEQLFAQLERLVKDLGLDPSKDALLPCGRTARFPPVNLEKSFDPKRTSRLGASDLRKLTDLAAGCRTAALGRIGGGSAGGRDRDGIRGGLSSYDNWVSRTVSEVDGAMSGCQDHTNPWVAEDPTSPFDKNHRSTVGVINRDPKAPPTTAPDAGTSIEDSLLLGGSGSRRKGADAGTPSTVPSTFPVGGGLVELALWLAMQQAAPPPSSTPPSTTAPKPGGGMPCDPDLGCSPSCEQRQRAWDMFKSMCEQSHWRSFPCVDFLRKVNGCVDMTLINPGPDGDLVCPRWGRETEAERRQHAWSEQCKAKKMVMMPTQDGRPLCVDRSLAKLPRPTIDPCHDPRAMPGPDDCGGGRGPIVEPSPRPVPDPHR